MYLYNKTILEYAQIVVSHVKSWILDIEGHSNMYLSDVMELRLLRKLAVGRFSANLSSVVL